MECNILNVIHKIHIIMRVDIIMVWNSIKDVILKIEFIVIIIHLLVMKLQQNNT